MYSLFNLSLRSLVKNQDYHQIYNYFKEKYDIQYCCLISNGYIASENGHLECLKYAHENDCTWDEIICKYAAKNGYIECLKYAHENGCPWNEETCPYAAKYGHLECLKYAHENGCPWNEWTCKHASENRHLECLKYYIVNDCECDMIYDKYLNKIL